MPERFFYFYELSDLNLYPANKFINRHLNPIRQNRRFIKYEIKIMIFMSVSLHLTPTNRIVPAHPHPYIYINIYIYRERERLPHRH